MPKLQVKNAIGTLSREDDKRLHTTNTSTSVSPRRQNERKLPKTQRQQHRGGMQNGLDNLTSMDDMTQSSIEGMMDDEEFANSLPKVLAKNA